ncbi:MAG: histidine-type phosphatase [Candidatus Sulfotelmatobacter sp.]
MKPWIIHIACLFFLVVFSVAAPTASQASKNADAELKFVVYVSRHGVRSPTGKVEKYSSYSIAPWPTWDVAPGYLTAHGYRLMEIFGAYDRMELASQGLLRATGCDDAAHVTIHADSEQRTRETGKAIASGLFPGCAVKVQNLPEGDNDPLFHSIAAGLGHPEMALAAAAISGRIGGDPNNLTNAYRTQLAALDKILATCGAGASPETKRTSLLDIPAKLAPGDDDGLAKLKGPLNTASTITENFLLEYTQGMDAPSVGWGCVDGDKLRSLVDLHTTASDFAQRTKAIARMQASNLLDHVRRAMEQSVTGKPVPGAPDASADCALFLIGHDTNLSNIAGLLDLTWIVDGRRDDTPPGAALIFELWKSRATGNYSVRTYYSAQTLEQMRSASKLTLDDPPQRVPVFLPGCSAEDFSCPWPSFAKTLDQAIDLHYVSSQ